MIKLKRAYDPPSPDDGVRILVDRLWPRGISKAAAKLDRWAKELAPSVDLRNWFCHDPAKWNEFQAKYEEELSQSPDALRQVADQAKTGVVTLVYGSKDEQHNQAVVLKSVLDRLI